jgi:hypothetical protein
MKRSLLNDNEFFRDVKKAEGTGTKHASKMPGFMKKWFMHVITFYISCQPDD